MRMMRETIILSKEKPHERARMSAANDHIVVLTGAGISAESGLDTFRDKDGIWSRVSIDEVATPAAFRRDPARVHAFYNERRRRVRAAAPNAAHYALAQLEAEFDGEVLVITQNIDDLHERAGTRNLIHMHGEILKARCTECDQVTPWHDDLSTDAACPACGMVGSLRPHVVWFGEMPLGMDEITEHLYRCDLFVSIGTSGSVYPAAGFVEMVQEAGCGRTVELNLDPSFGENLFTERVYGHAGKVVPSFVSSLLTLQP